MEEALCFTVVFIPFFIQFFFIFTYNSSTKRLHFLLECHRSLHFLIFLLIEFVVFRAYPFFKRQFYFFLIEMVISSLAVDRGASGACSFGWDRSHLLHDTRAL